VAAAAQCKATNLKRPRKEASNFLQMRANPYEKFSKCFLLVRFECEHMKASRRRRGAKFNEKNMAAAKVNEKANRK